MRKLLGYFMLNLPLVALDLLLAVGLYFSPQNINASFMSCLCITTLFVGGAYVVAMIVSKCIDIGLDLIDKD